MYTIQDVYFAWAMYVGGTMAALAVIIIVCHFLAKIEDNKLEEKWKTTEKS